MSNSKITTFQRINKGLEYFWLVLTVAAAFMAVWFIVNEGYDEAKWYLLFPLLAMMMYFLRRGLRKKFEATLKRMQEEEALQKKGKNK